MTVLLNGFVEVDAVDLSAEATGIADDDAREEIDDTGFGPEGVRTFDQGLRDATITITFKQGFGTGSVYETLEPLFENGDTFTLRWAHNGSTPSIDNPIFSMTARLFALPKVTGSVGELMSFDESFRNASTAGITKATA